MKIKLVVGVVASALVFAAAGCSANGDSGGKKIGIVTFSSSDTQQNQIIDGLKARASELGYDAEVVDSNGSVDQANSAMQNLATSQVDAIVVTIFPPDSLGGGLAAAASSGIPVFAQGSGLGNGVLYDVNLNNGDPLGERVADDLATGGRLLELTYKTGAPCLAREQSLDTALQGRSDIVVTKQEITIPGQTESGRAAAIAWLSANPPQDGSPRAIWGCFDDPVLGALSGLKEQGVDDVSLYSFGSSVDALKAVQAGEIKGQVWLDLTSAGQQIAEAIDEHAQAPDTWTPKSEDGAYELIDPSTFDAFVAEHPEALQ